MKTPPTKRSFQAALALTLLACSGLTGCSEGQEQSASSSADGRAAVATTHTKAATATPKASSKAKVTGAPTATGASSTTSSPTATLSPELEASREQARNKQPPPKPELITVNNDDGAIATAKYWVQLYHYTYSSGKTNEYKALCPGDNFGCAGIIKGAIENHSEGGWVEPADIKFTEAYRRDDFPDSMVVQINYKQDGFNQYYGDGSAKYYKPESRWALVELSYRNNQWIVIRQKNGSFD